MQTLCREACKGEWRSPNWFARLERKKKKNTKTHSPKRSSLNSAVYEFIQHVACCSRCC